MASPFPIICLARRDDPPNTCSIRIGYDKQSSCHPPIQPEPGLAVVEPVGEFYMAMGVGKGSENTAKPKPRSRRFRLLFA
jgi:hypothetical protein